MIRENSSQSFIDYGINEDTFYTAILITFFSSTFYPEFLRRSNWLIDFLILIKYLPAVAKRSFPLSPLIYVLDRPKIFW